MSRCLYIDDPEIGLSKDTSHPDFVKIAQEDFYYDEACDFAPFGSDDGSDAFSALQDWYAQEGDEDIADFLEDFLSGWGFDLPVDILLWPTEELEAWLGQDDMNERYLQAECRARVAFAFGQLKISGAVSEEMLKEGLSAIKCQLGLNERARSKYPDWRFADEERNILLKLQATLSLFGVKPSIEG